MNRYKAASTALLVLGVCIFALASFCISFQFGVVHGRYWPKLKSMEEDERRKIVTEEAGPAPHPRAIPVRGYTTKGGVKHKSYWRTPPDASTENNLP